MALAVEKIYVLGGYGKIVGRVVSKRNTLCLYNSMRKFLFLAIIILGSFIGKVFWQGRNSEEKNNELALNTTVDLQEKRNSIKNQIKQYADCESDADCEVIDSKCPFGCYVAVNRDKLDEIKKNIEEYPNECENSCRLKRGTKCEDKKCKVIF